MRNIKEQIARVRNSKDAKNLLVNFFSLSVLQVAGYVFPLITLPYLARVIGVVKFGEIAFASAVMIYFQTLVDYGFIFSAVRDIARCREDRNAVSEIYSRVMWARFCLTVLAFVFLCFMILLVPKFYEMRIVLLLSFLLVPGQAMFPDWMFQALEKMKYITIFNVLIKLIFTVAIFLFVKKESDYILQPVFNAMGFIVSGIGSMYLISKWGIKLKLLTWRVIWSTIKSNTDLFFNQLVPNLYNSLSVLLLGFFHGSAANGIYDAGNKFNTIASNLISVISRTFFPFLSRRIDKHYILVRLNFVLSSSMAFVLFMFAPLIIHIFFTEDFYTAVAVLRIMSLSLVFLAMSNAYSTNWLIVKGYEKDARKITVIASLVGFAMAIPLVYLYSYIGAAIVITSSRGIMALLAYWKVRKIKVSRISI